MGDCSLTPSQMVGKKLKDIKKQADDLRKNIDSHVNKVSIECRYMADCTPGENYGDFPRIFFKLDHVSELLRNMNDKLQGAGHRAEAARLELEMTSKETSSDLLSRIERLESLISSARVQSDGLQQNQQDCLDLLRSQRTKLIEQEKKMEEVLTRVTTLENEKKRLQKELKDVDEKQSSRLSDGLQEVAEDFRSRIYNVNEDIFAISKTTQSLESQAETLGWRMDELKDSDNDQVKSMNKVKSQLKQFKGRVTVVDSKIGQLCQLLSTKVIHLEKVRDALNQAHARVQVRSQLERQCNSNKRMINAQAECIAGQSARITRLAEQMVEKRSTGSDAEVSLKPAIGFTAQFNRNQRLKKGFGLRHFDHVSCNVGGCFNKKFGTFTAAHAGLYCFVLVLAQCDKKSFDLAFVKQLGVTKNELLEFIVREETVYTVQGVLHLGKDESVSVVIKEADEPFQLHHSTTFSGWFIG